LLVQLQTVQLLLLVLTSITEELRLSTLPDFQVTLLDLPHGGSFFMGINTRKGFSYGIKMV
jgi:hypothetical protein